MNLHRLPPDLKFDLQAEQFKILHMQVPILYAVLAINTILLASSIYGQVSALLSIVAPAGFLLLIVTRILIWRIRRDVPASREKIARYLIGTTAVATVVAMALGLWGILLLNSNVGDQPFVPLFIALGSVACAFCLSSLPRAAFATICFATAPVTGWLLFSSTKLQVTTGLTLLVIFALILRLVVHQYRYLVEKVVTHDRMRTLAYTDPLTQLPNRTLFEQRLDQALCEADRGRDQVALIVLDVDRFKTVNDSMGHAAGDALLKEIAARLLRTVPATGTAARLGGDEFAIILPQIAGQETAMETIRAMLHGLDAPILFDGRLMNASVSAGAAIWPGDGGDADELLRSADLALYAAKGKGSGLVNGFRPAMRLEMEKRMTMLAKARAALTDDRIVPFYQPKIRMQTGEVVGFEALLRWHDPTIGLQAPHTILAALEDNELATHITDRMMDTVFADMRLWLDSGAPFGKIAINGAPADFLRGDFADRLLGRLADFGVPAERVELEVTESVFFGELVDSVERTLHGLHDAGVTIALDDFGTGYASLSHLKQFPVDVLKIDRSFVSRLTDTEEEEDAVIVAAVLNLAQNLRIMTVAEGIETAAQAAYLRRKGCDLGQGFLFSPAVAAAHVPALARRRFLRASGDRPPRGARIG